jgi:GH35 family endo-1,4-beta-xylanase
MTNPSADRLKLIRSPRTRIRLVRRGLLALPAIVLCLSIVSSGAESGSADSLKGAGDGSFRIGVAVGDRIAARPADWPLIEAQFNSVTAENCLKPDPVQTAEGKFNFTEADALVDFASARHLQIVGHCLVWARDERTPGWFFRDGRFSKVSGTETPARFRMPFSLSVWIHGIC